MIVGWIVAVLAVVAGVGVNIWMIHRQDPPETSAIDRWFERDAIRRAKAERSREAIQKEIDRQQARRRRIMSRLSLVSKRK